MRHISEAGRASLREAGLRTHKANFEKRLVPKFKLQPLAQELLERCGTERAAASAADIGRNTLRCVLYGKRCEGDVTRDFVHKDVARKIILALHEKRRADRRDKATTDRFRKAAIERARIEERMLGSYY